METSNFIKYLDFLSSECDRYLAQRNLKDDDINALIVELERVKNKCIAGDISADFRSKILAIEFDYSLKDVERSGYLLVVAIITFGISGYIVHLRNQEARKKALQGLKFDTSRLASFAKMNFDY